MCGIGWSDTNSPPVSVLFMPDIKCDKLFIMGNQLAGMELL